MSAPLVSLRSVGVTLSRTPILTDVTLVLGPGDITGIVGANGSGKSTLLSVLATFLRPTSGDGSVLGAALGTREVAGVRTSIGWVGHDPGLHPHLTLCENLELESSSRGLSTGAARSALEAVGLGGAVERLASNCSNGMRRRADLARLLMAPPSLLLLDEAEAGLDEPAQDIIDHLLRRTAAGGGAAVMVTHDPERIDGRFQDTRRLIDGVLT